MTYARIGSTIRAIAVLASGAAGAAPCQGWLDVPQLTPDHGSGKVIAAGDANGDALPDLLWHGTGSTRFFISSGSGTYAAAAPLGIGPLDLVQNTKNADLTQDGFGELVLWHLTGAAGAAPVHELRLFPSSASGTVGTPWILQIPGNYKGSHAVQIGDCDGDGDLDLATMADHGFVGSMKTEVRWWRFEQGGFLSSPPAMMQTRAQDFEAFDYNSDGTADLILSELPGKRLHLFASSAGAPTASGVVTLPFSLSLLTWLDSGELDGAGGRDLFASQIDSGGARWVASLSSGTSFSPLPEVMKPFSIESVSAGDFAFLGDWDGDGKSELALAGMIPTDVPPTGIVGFHIFRFGPGMSDALAGSSPLSAVPSASLPAPGFVDMNLDGRVDFVSSRCIVWGNGLFEHAMPAGNVALEGLAPGMIVDIDSDGDLDHLRGSDRLLGFFPVGFEAFNDGTGTLTQTGIALPTQPGVTYQPAFAVGDLDQDGAIEVIALRSQGLPSPSSESRILRPTFSSGYVDSGPAGNPPAAFVADSRPIHVLVDLDGDGDLDVLDSSGPVSPSVQGGFRANDGFGRFGDLIPLFTGIEPVDAFDYDLDGDADLLGSARAPSLPFESAVICENQSQQFLIHPVYGSSFAPYAPLLSDLDGDGRVDIGLSRAAIGANIGFVALLNRPTGFVVGAQILFDSYAAAVSDLWCSTDVDGDGILDLISGRNSVTGSADRIAVRRGLVSGFQYEPARFYVGSALSGFADFDGDGDVDLLGAGVIKSRRFEGAAAGSIQQYGTGIAGAAGAVPALGAKGPIRPGSDAELRLGRAASGAPTAILIGQGRGPIVDFAIPGLTLWLDSLVTAEIAVVTGPPAPGAGSWSFGLQPLLPSLVGQRWNLQAVSVDPAASAGIASSPGLEILFGF
ncbi:MAG: VCBS repeat-containing protein [Planctomycetes bacterium]|nr:VCBS repeat-containing protein [Planctomycetota bacterium]